MMPESIEDYTEVLFSCRFADDSFDPEGEEWHLKESRELFDHYSWPEVFPVWFRYLTEKCLTASDVINFANLYVYPKLCYFCTRQHAALTGLQL